MLAIDHRRERSKGLELGVMSLLNVLFSPNCFEQAAPSS
jgi:hypothetical protein